MKRLFFVCLFLMPGVAAAQSSVPSASPAVINLATPIPGMVQVLLPKDISMVVNTTESLNSYSAHQGEKIHYVVTQDLVVAGYLIAKAGDTAEGQVQEGQAGDSGGYYGIGWKAANLRVSVDKIYTYCGSELQVAFDRSEYRRRQGIFGSHKDVEVIKGQKYVPVVDHPQQVCATKTTEETLPIPSDALTADKG